MVGNAGRDNPERTASVIPA